MGRNLSKQLMQRFLKHMIVYAVVVLLFLLAAYVWCKNRIWYPSPEYYLLNGIEDNIVSVILIVFLVVQLLIPQLITTIQTLVGKMPGFATRVWNHFNDFLGSNPQIMEWVNGNTDTAGVKLLLQQIYLLKHGSCMIRQPTKRCPFL